MAASLMLAAASPTTARAPTPERVYRLAHLAFTAESERATRSLTLPDLAKLGFVEGRNLVFDARVGPPDALAGLMQDLLAGKPDAIITIGATVIAATQATRTVPIVMFGANPVELGLAASLARPGGNVTGVVILAAELDAKRLHLLQEAVPGRRRVAVLLTASRPPLQASEREMRIVAASTGLDLHDFIAATPADYPAAFAAMRKADVQALMIAAAAEFSRDAVILAALALEARLPTMCEWAEMARDGCLIGYGPDRSELRRRMADQVARIFRGTAPGEIPIEEPQRFEFAVNLKVARALGLEMPPAILGRADEVIE